MASDFNPQVRDTQEWLEACARRQSQARWFRGPLLTGAMAVWLCLVYAEELHLEVRPAGGSAPSLQTLLAMGGLNLQLVVGQGEWYRLFTAAFLHGNLTHLASNVAAFIFAGYALEWLVGRSWMFLIFFLGILGGSMVSLALAPADVVVGVGASGAIMAQLAALLTLGLRLPPGRVRNWTLTNVVLSLVPALIPQSQVGGMHVDFGAHLGGALVGAVMGLLLWLMWRREQPEAPARLVAALGALTGVCVLGICLMLAAQHYPDVLHLTLPPRLR